MKTGYWLKYWATAALNLSLSSISLMCRGMEFQSMTVLGINEYFRQFLFVAIWINWLCLDERRTGRRIVCVGMARRPHRAWCKMETLLTFLLSSNDSYSCSFFHFCDATPTFIVACYEMSTRVSKWSYQHLIIETLRFFVFERTKHQPRRNLRSYVVLQIPCNEAALSPGIDAFWY